MRDFSDSTKLTFRSLPEVLELVANVVSKHRARGLRLGPVGPSKEGRFFSREIYANALFVYFSSLDVGEQERILRATLGDLARLLAVDPDAAPAAEAPRQLPIEVRSADPDVKSGRSRRKRGG